MTDIQAIINQLRPALQSDGGDMEFVDFDQQTGILCLKFQGACAHCPLADITFKNLIADQIQYTCPEVKEIKLV